MAALDRANAEAWSLYGRICNRFAVDVGIVPELVRALVDGWPGDDVADLIERCGVMYDVLSPPKSD